ncbi:VOC family protein [Georgenia sp. SYP-B2076]|uniref:VOC family protein n=1 Tax=Georgenia sp. SYP-B2076 TaxID=2495881 RepID=UPI000F8D4E34|nr:VOC family protein [Georgenia sp. SYP-B2076]
MLSTYTPVPTLAVKDLASAREFYEGVLGFTAGDDVPDGVLYTAGASQFLVYPSSYAGTNKATAVSFQVPADAFDTEIAALREKGLEFQTFDLDGASWSDGVMSMGDERVVWFADPDGNIIAVETAG